MKDYTAFAQTKEDVSLYTLIEGLSKINISESNNETVKVGNGGCTKLWKMKNGRPQKWQQMYSKYQEDGNPQIFGSLTLSELLTEEELDEKRQNIEERSKDRKIQACILISHY